MIASVLVVTTAGWFVTERIVEPRLGKWDPDNDDPETESETKQDLTSKPSPPSNARGFAGP